MFRFQKNDRYTAIAIYAFIVLALLMLGVVLCINIPYLLHQFSALVNLLRPVTFALAFAYVCNPLVRFAEKRLLCKMKNKPHLTRALAIALSYLFLIVVLAVLLFMMLQ